ncbi:MAG: hypothetical protein BZY82_02640 [SAR202 cluster bacterium Io17-Chloro-G3]|nr:MAG: hypothetical protein BZY82_02640 [SAR202 cluster bacterium Io17-Chloro-G3]
MIRSLEALRAIHVRRGNALVVATMTGRREWAEISDQPQYDMVINSMGKASNFGLGLALAQPQRRVIVIDGDGSFLMNINTIITTSGKQPLNMIHIVLENGGYTATGGEPLAGTGVTNFTEMAAGAGFAAAYEFSELEDFVGALDKILTQDGPVFVMLHVQHEQLPRKQLPTAAETALAMTTALGDG